MADDAPGNPPPNPNDPWLEGLTFEQLAQLVNEVSPDVFYQRASAFDQAGSRLQDVLDRIRHEMNLVREAWNGKASEDFDALVREVTGKVSGALQFLQNPGYGATLRGAGDRLADHQQRFRDLQGQKAEQESAPPAPGAPPPEVTAKANGDSARQILRDLRTAYWDVGNTLAPFPYKAPQVVADPTVVNTSDPNDVHDPDNLTNKLVETAPDPGDANANMNTNTFAPTTLMASQSGLYGGGGPFRPDGQGGQVLGRVDPGARSWTGPGDQSLVGPGWTGSVVPGQAGLMFSSGQPRENTPAVLGQSRSVTREPDPLAGEEAGVGPIGAVSPAVLGRSVACQPAGKETSKKDAKKKAVEEPLQQAETLSTDALAEPNSITIRTAVDAPTAPVAEKAREIAAQVATASAQSVVTAQGTPVPEAAVPPPAETAVPDAKPALESGVEPRKSFALTVSSGGGGGVTHAVALDPESRGMFAPGSATPDAVVVAAEPVTGPSGRGGPVDPYSSHMGGFPMSPMMMGGMGGQMQQQNGRMAAMPNEPRPEVWDPSTGAPIAVGRREPEPETREPELSQADVQARLAEKFAELDRLLERGK